jgi:mRNA interferase HicA
VKRGDLIRYLHEQGCEVYREGSRHTIYLNPALLTTTAIPRHQEIGTWLARKICNDLQVPPVA